VFPRSTRKVPENVSISRSHVCIRGGISSVQRAAVRRVPTARRGDARNERSRGATALAGSRFTDPDRVHHGTRRGRGDSTPSGGRCDRDPSKAGGPANAPSPGAGGGERAATLLTSEFRLPPG